MLNVLTERCQIGVLGAEQEKVHSDLLTRAVQCQFLVEVGGRAEVLNSLQRHVSVLKNDRGPPTHLFCLFDSGRLETAAGTSRA